MPLHAFEAVAGRGGRGEARHLRQVAGRTETKITGEAKLGIDLEDVRELRELVARVLVERFRDEVGIGGIAAGVAFAVIVVTGNGRIARSVGAEIAIAADLAGGVEGSSRTDQNRIEEAVAL